MVRELAKGDFIKMLPNMLGSMKSSTQGNPTASIDTAVNSLLIKLIGGK